MSAVTRVKARHVAPVGYEYIVRGRVSETLTAGDQVVQTGTTSDGHPVYSKAGTSVTAAHGIALEDATAIGQLIDIGKVGEMDGFSGMTPGADIFPSASTAGGLDTTAPAAYSVATTPAVAVPALPKVRALTATRIFYNYV
jgi:hypothetical protein